MNFKKVADHFRNTTTPLAVSNIVIVSDEGDFTGNGKLQRNGEALELEVTLSGDRELPAVGGILKREHFWKIGGVIEGQVPFWGVSVPHAHQIQTARFVVRGGHFHFDRIHHLPLLFGDGGLRDALLNTAHVPPERVTLPARGFVDARLTDYQIVWREEMTVTVEQNPFLGDASRTKRDTLEGEVDVFEYGLIQRDLDCYIHLRLKKDASASVSEITRVSQALYRALAFVHGRHSWPQWERIDSGAGSVLEYATALRSVSANIHTPLTERTCANGSDVTALIAKAVRCFLRADAFSQGLDSYLSLAREAASEDTPAHVGTLGLCAVFEGFVSFLHEHLCAGSGSSGADEFEQVRSSLVELATERVGNTGLDSAMVGAWTRFIGLLQSVRSLRPADKYRQLVEHFRLSTEKMSLAVEAWKEHRHPLAHGASPNDDLIDEMLATSRIAGAINVLAAAAVGYSGVMVLSRIDDQFIRLP